MLRKLFSAGNSASAIDGDELRVRSNVQSIETGTSDDERTQRAPQPGTSSANAGFEEIYRTARLPASQWGIPKLREMAESPHLAGMNTEMKRCAILMALDAAGAKIEDILQDAVLRQKALNEYEDKEEIRLRDHEAVKTEQSRTIQAELNRITAQNMARIQTNVDEIARQQDQFRAWQKRKSQEAESIATAAALLIPQGNAASGNSTLATVLERASAAYR
jgi:hypothetical protein